MMSIAAGAKKTCRVTWTLPPPLLPPPTPERRTTQRRNDATAALEGIAADYGSDLNGFSAADDRTAAGGSGVNTVAAARQLPRQRRFCFASVDADLLRVHQYTPESRQDLVIIAGGDSQQTASIKVTVSSPVNDKAGYRTAIVEVREREGGVDGAPSKLVDVLEFTIQIQTR